MADRDDTTRTLMQVNDDLTVYGRLIYEAIDMRLIDRERIKRLEAEVADLRQITPPDEVATVLQRQPWFLPRMTEDNWSFGFLLANGDRIRITTILAVKLWHGQLWLDVELEEGRFNCSPKDITAPTSRLTASVNAAHIVMAFETADT